MNLTLEIVQKIAKASYGVHTQTIKITKRMKELINQRDDVRILCNRLDKHTTKGIVYKHMIPTPRKIVKFAEYLELAKTSHKVDKITRLHLSSIRVLNNFTALTKYIRGHMYDNKTLVNVMKFIDNKTTNFIYHGNEGLSLNMVSNLFYTVRMRYLESIGDIKRVKEQVKKDEVDRAGIIALGYEHEFKKPVFFATEIRPSKGHIIGRWNESK